MTHELLEPILDDGVEYPHFFEGRVLTSSDMTAEREAHQRRQRHLGRALGPGVVEGLWVETESSGAAGGTPVLRVAGGLALDGEGRSLEIKAGSELIALTEPPPGAETDDLFRACRPPSTGVDGSGEGLYLLVLSPAAGYRGRAPMSGLGEPKAGAGCGSRWRVEGVQLRLEAIDPAAASGLTATTRDLLSAPPPATAAGRSRWRSAAAHLVLGTEARARFAADPFARQAATLDRPERSAFTLYGGLGDLRDNGRLTGCDVPLALVYWTLDGGVEWVDCWAARRRPQPPPGETDWPTLSGGRSRAEAEAALFQFQRQLADELAAAAVPTALRARDHFRWLPPAGLVPLTDPARPRGLTVPGFWQGRTLRGPLFMEGDRLGAVLARSLTHLPFAATGDEMVWLYQLRQNRQPAAGQTAAPAPAYLVFTGAHLGFFGEARFDVNRWNYANYSSVLV